MPITGLGGAADMRQCYHRPREMGKAASFFTLSSPVFPAFGKPALTLPTLWLDEGWGLG